MLIYAGVPAFVSSEQSKKLGNQTGRPLALALALAVSETATSSLGLVTGPLRHKAARRAAAQVLV